MEALIRKILGFLGGAGHYNLLVRVIGKSFGLVWWEGQLAGVGKLNGWVLELNFAGQVIHFKSLFCIIYSFTEFFLCPFIHLFIYLITYLFIH